jgi:hypothetical protein
VKPSNTCTREIMGQNPVNWCGNLCCSCYNWFFISPSYQNCVKEIGQAASFIQYLGFGGFAIAIWKMLTDWRRENVLEYDDVYS